MTNPDPVLDLLQRFQQEGVEYVLVGGQAVRLNGFCEHGSSLVGGLQVLQAYATQPSSNSNNKGSKATVSNLTEQFFKAYNANDMQRVRQYVTSDIVYIEMEVKTRFVLLRRLGATEPGDFAF